MYMYTSRAKQTKHKIKKLCFLDLNFWPISTNSSWSEWRTYKIFVSFKLRFWANKKEKKRKGYHNNFKLQSQAIFPAFEGSQPFQIVWIENILFNLKTNALKQRKSKWLQCDVIQCHHMIFKGSASHLQSKKKVKM